MTGEIPDPAVNAHPVPQDERLAQLQEFAELCGHLASALADHGDRNVATHLAALRSRALELMSAGFEQSDLNDLGYGYPEYPVPWLHPKMGDFDSHRESWQDQVAHWHKQARALSLALRAVATW